MVPREHLAFVPHAAHISRSCPLPWCAWTDLPVVAYQDAFNSKVARLLDLSQPELGYVPAAPVCSASWSGPAAPRAANPGWAWGGGDERDVADVQPFERAARFDNAPNGAPPPAPPPVEQQRSDERQEHDAAMSTFRSSGISTAGPAPAGEPLLRRQATFGKQASGQGLSGRSPLVV